MSKASRARLREALGKHYASRQENPARDELNALVRAMVAEDARARRTYGRRMGFASFVGAQVRYIPVWTWAAQALVVALMVAVAQTSGGAAATELAVGVLSATTVLVGAPTALASKRHGVAELEYACANNAASVMTARLVVLGCSSSLAVALMVGVTAVSTDVGALLVALWACPPFFCSCAGALAILRRAAPSVATVTCASWVVVCSVALGVAARAFPQLYDQASLAVWATAAAAALAWLVREAATTIRAVAGGLDVFDPYLMAEQRG